MNIQTYLNKVFRWDVGRQQSGYDKMLLLTGIFPLPFDVYLLKFPVGSEILIHVDAVDYGKHYRLNVIIRKAQLGGDFFCSKTIFKTDRINFFRPDISKHSVSKVKKGIRYVLSIGWVKSC